MYRRKRKGTLFGKPQSEVVHPSRRGDFTAKAERAGMGVQEFANHVLSPDSNADTLTKHQAVFARNARKFHH